MTKFKKWLTERYLPAYAKESILEDNKRLNEAVRAQAQKIRELEAYIDGVQSATKSLRKIVINNDYNGRGETD